MTDGERTPGIRVIRTAALSRVLWKNGGGSTVELAVFPSTAGLDEFAWRLSLADVATDGPFSVFPAIDRTLVLLDGAGLDLDIAGRTQRIDANAPLLSFPGDVATEGRLVRGPIRDFNVMTRRGVFTHTVDTVASGALAVDAITLLLAWPGPCDLRSGSHAWHLAPRDAILCSASHTLELQGHAFRARLSAV